MIELDAKDKKILYQLDVNARQPVSAIAKKVGLSREVVDYRIKNLEKNDVIEGYYAAIDVTKLGYMYYRIYMSCRAISPKQQTEIVNYGLNYPTIGWITVGHGRWNISFGIYARNFLELERTCNDVRLGIGKYFEGHYFSVVFKIYHYKHNYLFGTSDHSQAVFGEYGERFIKKVDAKDLLLLRLLAKNARTGLVELAKLTGLKSGAVSKRIRRLFQDRVILAFKLKINITRLGYEHYKVFLTFKNTTQEKQREIFTYLRYQPGVIYITKAFGLSDLEFEVVLKGKNELYLFMQDFLARFSDFVADYETILRYRELVSYMPKELS